MIHITVIVPILQMNKLKHRGVNDKTRKVVVLYTEPRST